MERNQFDTLITKRKAKASLCLFICIVQFAQWHYLFIRIMMEAFAACILPHALLSIHFTAAQMMHTYVHFPANALISDRSILHICTYY